MTGLQARLATTLSTALAAIGLCAPLTPAYALTTPDACNSDAHMRCARFEPDQVYRLPYRPGNATVIQLEPGEVIDGPASGLGMGDANAWQVGAKSNWILFKPKEAHADTNLMIITDRRRYAIQLVTAHPGEVPVWMLTFDYPDTRARQALEAAKRGVLAADRARSGAAAAVHTNENFDMRGSTALAPTSMWDDGRFTYLRYATSRDQPDIYALRPDGAEASVNTHVDGDTVVVHGTAANFILRLGAAVLAIRNNGYTPDGQFNAAGTTVPGVVRVLKEPISKEQRP